MQREMFYSNKVVADIIPIIILPSVCYPQVRFSHQLSHAKLFYWKVISWIIQLRLCMGLCQPSLVSSFDMLGKLRCYYSFIPYGFW